MEPGFLIGVARFGLVWFAAQVNKLLSKSAYLLPPNPFQASSWFRTQP